MTDEGDPDEAAELLGVRFPIQPSVLVASAKNPHVGHRAKDETGQDEKDDDRRYRQERHIRSVAVAGIGRYGRKVPTAQVIFDEGRAGIGQKGLVAR